VSGLAYDAISDTLYTVILYYTPRSDLARVKADTASVSVVGKIADGLSLNLCWRECDGQLNSYLIHSSGSWDSPDKASIITIDPNTVAMTTIFQTAYHTIMGLARRPGQDSYVSWINWTSHFYGEVNLEAHTITSLANSDPVGGRSHFRSDDL